MKAGGLGKGGFNFDAKIRRDSLDIEDYFHAHIGAVDVVARAFRIAGEMHKDGLEEIRPALQHLRRGIGDIESAKPTSKACKNTSSRKASPTQPKDAKNI